MRVRLGEIRRLLGEELKPLELPMHVYGPFHRGRGEYVVAVAWDWKTFENERASMRLRQFQDAQIGGPMMQNLTRAEKETVDQHDSAFAVPLDADNDREARFQAQMVASKLEGIGFKVEYLPLSRYTDHPYR
jgi:hypothetical protein